jgi:hypothetical protein
LVIIPIITEHQTAPEIISYTQKIQLIIKAAPLKLTNLANKYINLFNIRKKSSLIVAFDKSNPINISPH